MENNNDDEVVRLRNKTITKFIGQDKGDYITISEMIKTIELFNLENVIENNEIEKIFDKLDYRGRGKVKKSILVENLQNSNTEQGYKLYQALTKNFNSKSEKIIHKLKFIKNHEKLKDEPELLKDISWIITTLADEDIYLPELSLDQNNGNKEMFGLMTNIEINQNKMNDLRVVNGSIDPYKTKSFMHLKTKRQTMLLKPIDNKGIILEEDFKSDNLINRCDFNLDTMGSNSKKNSLFYQPTDLSHMMNFPNNNQITIQKQQSFNDETFSDKMKSFTMDDMHSDNRKDSNTDSNENINNITTTSSNLKNPKNSKKSDKKLIIIDKNNTESFFTKPNTLSPKHEKKKSSLSNVSKNGVKITSIKNENESPVKKTKFKLTEKKDDKKNEQNSNNNSLNLVNSIKINNLTDLSSEAYEILDFIDDPTFDIFDLDKILHDKTLYYITHTVFKEKKYFDKLTNIETFNNFIQAITAEGYTRDIPYHNDLHAADVFQTVFVFFTQGEFEEVRI